MKFTEISSRITGVSCPLFGVQWEPPTSDVAVARSVIIFLEDRRVLYVPYEAEDARHCIESVLAIRHFLTGVLKDGGIGSELAEELRRMRAACRRFLADAGVDDQQPATSPLIVPNHWGGEWHNGLQDWGFNQALGQLRGSFSEPIARVAVKYGIDIEAELESILPAVDDDPRPRRRSRRSV